MAKFFRLRINLQSRLRSLSVSSDFLEPLDYESVAEIAAKAKVKAKAPEKCTALKGLTLLSLSVFVKEVENLVFGRLFQLNLLWTNNLPTPYFHPQPPDEPHRSPTTAATSGTLPTLPMASR